MGNCIDNSISDTSSIVVDNNNNNTIKDDSETILLSWNLFLKYSYSSKQLTTELYQKILDNKDKIQLLIYNQLLTPSKNKELMDYFLKYFNDILKLTPTLWSPSFYYIATHPSKPEIGINVWEHIIQYLLQCLKEFATKKFDNPNDFDLNLWNSYLTNSFSHTKSASII